MESKPGSSFFVLTRFLHACDESLAAAAAGGAVAVPFAEALRQP
jgi:hypothetical protein